MEVFARAISFIADPANWGGTEGIGYRIYEHVIMSVQAVALGAALALPVGLSVGHTRRFEFVSVSVGNLGRALPSFGIVALTYVYTYNLPGNIGFWPTFIALTALSVPPILLNSYVGVREVDPDAVEAVRGMGMSGMQILRRVELPLAAPLIVAGIRTAAVQVVATATLGAFTGWGGLGRYIVDGFATRDYVEVSVGAILVAALAVATELSLGLLERAVAPRLSSGRAGEGGRDPYRLAGAA